MKLHFASIIGFLSLLPTVTWAEDGGSTQAQVAPIAYSEVSRKLVDFGDHKVTLIRVRPPVFPKLPPPPTPPPVTPEQQAAYDRLAEKGYASLTVNATVYLGGRTPVTKLRWRDETGAVEYRAFSNVDFRYLTQLSSMETETTVYSWFPFVDTWDLAEWPAGQKSPIPPGLVFSTTEAEYFVEPQTKELKDQEITLAGLDYLHAYYQINYAALRADYEKREAKNAAREKELREHPQIKPDTVIRFWPIKSRVNPR